MSVQSSASNMQSSPKQHNPCCTINLCCGQKGSWRDVFMFVLEAGGVTAAASAFVYLENNYLGGGVSALTAFTGIAHYLWHRDAEVAILHQVVVDMQRTEQEMDATTKKTAQVVQSLTTQDEEISQDVEDLTKIKGKIERANSNLMEQVKSLRNENTGLKNQIKLTTKPNGTLKEQIRNLKQVVKEIKDNISQFNAHNIALKSNIAHLDLEVSKFDKEEKGFQELLTKTSQDLKPDVEQLTQIVEQSRITTQEIFRMLAAQINLLNQSIATLKAENTSLKQDEETIQKRTEQLAALDQQIEEREKTLKQRQEEFQQINQQLSQAKSNLESTLKKYQETENKMSSDDNELKSTTDQLTELAGHFDDLGKRLEIDIDAMKKVEEQTEEQKKEIENL